jgi:hypothetical protein
LELRVQEEPSSRLQQVRNEGDFVKHLIAAKGIGEVNFVMEVNVCNKNEIDIALVGGEKDHVVFFRGEKISQDIQPTFIYNDLVVYSLPKLVENPKNRPDGRWSDVRLDLTQV